MGWPAMPCLRRTAIGLETDVAGWLTRITTTFAPYIGAAKTIALGLSRRRSVGGGPHDRCPLGSCTTTAFIIAVGAAVQSSNHQATSIARRAPFSIV